MHSNFADFSICSPCCERTPGKKTRSCFCPACAHSGLLTFALLLLCVMERTKFCWAGRQEIRLLCAFSFTCKLSQRVTGRNQSALVMLFQSIKTDGGSCQFFFFFHKDGRKALNMNLLSYKTADVHLALDLKVNTKPEGHLVLPRMKIKV